MLERLFSMSPEEYDRLNPPFKLGEMPTNSAEWNYVGYIPTPKTRMGWFVYNLIHGIAMRYRFLPVLAFSIRELFASQSGQEITMVFGESEADESESDIWCRYDDLTDSLLVYFDGKPVPTYVNWINDRFGTLHDSESHAIVGVMIEPYRCTRRAI